MTQNAEALLERNLTFLLQNFPQLLERIELLAPTQTQQERDSTGRIVNIRLDAGHLLYPEGEAAITEQVQSFLADPTRFVFADTTHINNLPDSIQRRLGNREWPLSAGPSADTGILIVVGLGLGLHLPALMTALKPRYLVVIEPVADFFAHSLHVVDWERIAAALRQRGGGLALVPGTDPRATFCDLTLHLTNDEWIGQIDGSYIYVHYQSEDIAAIIAGLPALLMQHGTSKGFLADERLMMRNTLTNILTYPVRTLSVPPQQELSVPVFLVGSGPSLDTALPVIKANLDRAVIVSCGTTLSLLLKNGITPHVQVEIENLPLVYDLMATLAVTYDLSPIHLIASTTVDPRVPALFGDVTFFVREGGCARQVVQSVAMLPLAEPNVVNAAFASLSILGGREYFLFGLDLGRPIDAAHHAKGSVYDNVLAHLDEEIGQAFVLTAPGNFGGTVSTSLYLDAARAAVEFLQAYLKCRIYNCSNGVAIDGAQPMRLERVKLGKTTVNPKAVLEDALAKLPVHGRELVEGLEFRHAAQRAHGLVELFADGFHGSTTTGVAGLADRGVDLLSRLSNPEAGLFKDSLWSILRAIGAFAYRLDDAEVRRVFLEEAEGEVSAAAVEFAQCITAILDELQAILDTAGPLSS